MQMDKIYKLAESIQRYLVGMATAEEEQVVEAWLEEDARHRELFAEYQKDIDLQKKTREYEVFDRDKAFRRFLNSRRQMIRRRIYRVSSIAAACLLGIGIFLLTWNKDVEVKIAENLPIQHGSSKAVLILPGGKEIALQDSMFMEVAGEQTRIKVEGNQVHYTGDLTEEEDTAGDVIMNSIVTPMGGEYRLILSDGTKVWLNADSRLDFPAKFAGDRREVNASGEVYFEVAKDAEHPFVVNVKDMHIRVLGTSFNVSAYSDENVLSTTLVEGSVELKVDGIEQAVRLEPGEQAALAGGQFLVRQVDTKLYTSWITDYFAFESESLERVLRKLSRWYRVDFKCDNQQMKEKFFTGNIPKYEDVQRVLEMIEMTTNITFKIEGSTIIVK